MHSVITLHVTITIVQQSKLDGSTVGSTVEAGDICMKTSCVYLIKLQQFQGP